MRIPLYNIFGDNYVKQVAIEAGKYEILRNAIEIDDNLLKEVLKIAGDIAKSREEKNKNKIVNILPLSRNDKGAWEKILKCYNFGNIATLSEVLYKFSPEAEKCNVDTAPSFVKPEFYEHARIPGKPGGSKSKMSVDGSYLVVAAAGWVLTRLGKVKVNEGNKLGVQLFTTTKSNLYKILENIKCIPGIKPETAFAIWIADKIINVNLNVYTLKVYLISDAVGQSPTTIEEGFVLDLNKLLMNKEMINDDIVYIASDALNIDSNTRNYSAKIINLVYEVISGSKRIEDLLYFANRDLIMISESNDERIPLLKRISRYANYLSNVTTFS
jgi:CRISPR-associated protein CsaX